MMAPAIDNKSEVISTYYTDLLEQSHERISEDSVANFVPHPNPILVAPDPPDTKSKQGIIFPETAIQDKNFGTVLAVPESCIYAVGNRVLFRSGGGTKMKFPGVGDCVLLQYTEDIDDEILGKFAGGRHFTRGPYGERGEGRAFFMIDPDGNETEVNTR